MIEQRTQEWLDARKGLVTGSSVGGILGLSPFVTRDDVMRRMVRESLGAESEFTGNVATEYGTANEDNAILDFRMETGINVEPAPFVRHPDGWIGASPDGYTSDGGLIEVKAPYSLRNAEAPVPFKSIADQEHYAAQIQVQLYCADRRFCHFFQWAPNGTRLEMVERDDEWLNANLPILRQFHTEFLSEIQNPDDHLAPKRIVIDTPQAAKMMAEWDEISEQMELLGERKRDLLADMVALAKNRNADFAGRKLTLTKKAGAVSYAKAIKALCPDADLEPYRGKASEFWGVR